MKASSSLKLVKFCVVFTSLALFLSSSTQAAPIELKVSPSIDSQMGKCPGKVTLTEQGRPYREGGYTIDGSAKLDGLAEKFSVASTDAFSVTWVAKLKPQYATCKASAGTTITDNRSSLSHLRLRFLDGKVYVILDMTGLSDANQLTPVILNQGVKDGNPIWSWGGTD